MSTKRLHPAHVVWHPDHEAAICGARVNDTGRFLFPGDRLAVDERACEKCKREAKKIVEGTSRRFSLDPAASLATH